MRIVGIDPGIARTGWGVIEVKSGKLEVRSFGCIETSKNLSTEKRLEEIFRQMVSILEKEKPDAFAIEELFFNTNAKTAMVVGQARGVILLTAAQHNIPIAIYTPLQVKIAITGYGRAEKNQVGQMVKILLHLDAIPKPDDTADALAIAVTHAFSYKMK